MHAHIIIFILITDLLAMLLHEQPQLLVDLFLGQALQAFAARGTLSALTLLFETLGVTQRIQCVIRRAHAWTNTCKHHNFDFVVSNERVSQHHGQLALTEGNVLALGGLTALLVEGTHAFFQAEQGLVDLGAFRLSILVITLTILRSLTTSQIDEQKLAAVLVSLLLNFNLCDGMTSARRVVGFRGVSRPHLVTLLDQVEDLVVVVHELLLESGNLDCVRLVLAQLEFIVFVEKIIDFAAVDFVHGHCHREIPLVILPIVNATLEEILDSDALDAVHCVRLAGARLPVRENGHYSLIEYQIKDGPHLVEVQLLVGFVLAESIIKFEFRVFNCFGHSINFILAIMNENLRVRYRDYIYLAVRQLLLEDRPLLEAHTDLHLVRKRVLLLPRQPLLLVLDHGLEVDIDLDSLQLVVRLALALELTNLLHLQPSRVSVDFDLVDLVRGRHFPRLEVASLRCRYSCTWHVDVGDCTLGDTGLGLGLYAKLLLEPIFPLLRGAVRWQALIFEFVQHSFWCHVINLVLLL